MRQLHQEAAGNTDGYQGRGDHHVDLDAGRTRGANENHDGGDRDRNCHSRQHEEEGRVSRAERNREQDDGDKDGRGASPRRSQAGDSPTGLRFVLRECKAAARDGLAGHALSSG
jgi:hypothetical protein